MESPPAIVPPRKGFLVWVTHAIEVQKAPSVEILHALSLFGRVENIAGVTFLAPTVERGRADIEVSAEYLESFGVVVLREVFVERIEPSELPRKVVMLKIFPIWAVDGGERPFVLAHGDES